MRSRATDLLSILQWNFPGTFQRGLVAEVGIGNGLAARRVVHHKRLCVAPSHHIGRFQEFLVVAAHQQRATGCFQHVGVVGQSTLDDHMAHSKCQCTVRTRTHAHPFVDRAGGRIEIGRDVHQLDALGAHIGEEVGVRHACLQNVRTPDHRVLGVEHVLELMFLGLHVPRDWMCQGQITIPVVEGANAESIYRGKPEARPLFDDAGCRHRRVDPDGVLAIFGANAFEFAGDEVQRFVPGNAFPLTRAARADALHRKFDAVRRIDTAMIGRALHAAARVVFVIRVVAWLFDALHDTVPDEHVPGT